MITYLKNMEELSWWKRVPRKAEVVEESSKKVEVMQESSKRVEIAHESSSKRAGDELEQEVVKKQKVYNEKETEQETAKL
ncbi:hypothetical protein Tco_0879722 [Tanacetum coccineum]